VPDYYSIRMRASAGQSGSVQHHHLSGAERLTPADEAEPAGCELMRRALDCCADLIQITFERVPSNQIRRISCLGVTTVTAANPIEARESAQNVLLAAGVSSSAIDIGFRHLLLGDNVGQSRRGALLISARNGDLLTGSYETGVRASHFDYSPESRDEIMKALADEGLSHFRTREALALATKVLATGILAEICWSDDSTYEAGYVSTLAHGYVRYPHFKPPGAVGGRVFYYDGAPDEVEDCIRCLRTQDMLIDGPVSVRIVSPNDIAKALWTS